MKKIIAGTIHALAVLMLLFSIFMLTLGTSDKTALDSIRQPEYITSSAFESRVSESVNDIFDYINLKDLFEKKGTLDLNQVIAQGERNGQPASYSLDYLIKYARSMGYYLNDKNELADDGPATLSHEEDLKNKIRVTYRAYMPDYQPSSPADGIMSMGQLARETLTYLAKYYAVRSEFFDHATNLKFFAYYAQGDKSVTYTNDAVMTPAQIADLGKYICTNSTNLEVRTNLKTAPSNVIPLLQARNPYDNGDYEFAVGIDTNFPAEDAFQEAAHAYDARRRSAIIGIILLSISAITAAVTLATLVLLAGHPEHAEDNRIYLFPLDKLPGDLVLLMFAGWFRAADHLTPALLDSIELILGSLPAWDFWETSVSFLLKYIIFVPLCLSIVRTYKADVLWHNTLIYRILQLVRYYIHAAALTAPKFWSYFLFLLPNAASFAMIVVLLIRFFQHQSLFAFLVAVALFFIMLAIDFYTWRIATGLTKAVNEQVKSERLKADLITNVSHDLKTPLTSIINYVDLLKREHIDNPRVQEYLAVLDQKSNRLKTLTEDLVEASKASSGNVNITLTEINYSEIVMQALGEFEDKFHTCKLEIVEHYPDHPVMILADGRHLWRVIENLLNNCCKYALRESRVYVDISEEDSRAVLTIKNISSSPLNISPEELTERFVRGDVSRTTEGSGLGLAIAKSLTALMHGQFVISIDGDLYKAEVILPKVTNKAKLTESTS